MRSSRPKLYEELSGWRGCGLCFLLRFLWLWSTTEGSSVNCASEIHMQKRIRIFFFFLFNQGIVVYCSTHINAQRLLSPTDDLAMKRIKQLNHLCLGKEAT